ncbi:MAG TPA: outer membrane beta-barrel protein [Geothrix sp.]|nr:outer membrane beta-barrel protein [Geothrix sp.]
MKTITLLMASLATSLAFAQDGPQLSVGLLAAQGNAATMTQKIWGGYTFQLGYQFTPEGYGVSIRPNVGWGTLPGKSDVPGRTPDSVWGPNSYQMNFWNVGCDFIFTPSDRSPLKIVTGPSAHLWQVDRINAVIPRMGDQSWRAGWRLGAEYPVQKLVNVGISYTLTEWTSNRAAARNWMGYKDDTATPTGIDGVNPSKPAYFTVYANYRF